MERSAVVSKVKCSVSEKLYQQILILTMSSQVELLKESNSAITISDGTLFPQHRSPRGCQKLTVHNNHSIINFAELKGFPV